MITLPPGLAILNCQEGDIKVSFDKDNPQEAARAERVVKDMLKRGYIIFVYDDDGKLHRATAFDANSNEYIIADRGYDEASTETEPSVADGGEAATAPKKNRRGGDWRRLRLSPRRGAADSRFLATSAAAVAGLDGPICSLLRQEIHSASV